MTTDTVHIGEVVGYIFTGYEHLTTAEVSCSLCACGQITGSELNKEDSYPLSKCGLVAANYLLCAFFWAIPRRPNSIRQRFGALCLFHLHRRVGLDRPFRNVGIQNSEAGELRRRKHTAFRTRRKFEIKKNYLSRKKLWFKYSVHSWLKSVLGHVLARPLGLPEFLNNQHMKMVKFLGLRTGRFYPPGDTLCSHFCWRLSRPQDRNSVCLLCQVIQSNSDKMPLSIHSSL